MGRAVRAVCGAGSKSGVWGGQERGRQREDNAFSTDPAPDPAVTGRAGQDTAERLRVRRTSVCALGAVIATAWTGQDVICMDTA